MTLSADDARRLATSDDPLDYQAIGFRCGLEIHQQLDTRKLFSPCPSEVVDPDTVRARAVAQYDRRLRASQSELGETDPAVLAELKRMRRFRYLSLHGLASLVELDEEPPHPMSEDALDVALTFAGLLGSRPAGEVHVMRKTVIDGSNTSGFQRTALVATGGRVDPEGGPDVSIWTIAVEEDSARKVDEAGGVVTWSLDRLGIPLIEVATGPDITDPEHAQRTAARLGALLRATGRVKRGLGTIRQDLNVSIAVGDRVEIKGTQDLRAVARVIERECRRQLWLHYVAETLRERGFEDDAVGEPVDVSDAFSGCDSKIVKDSLAKGGAVFGLALPKWAGLIRGDSDDGPRYGREFADHAKVRAGVKGVFHSDELPAYGITETEVDAAHEALGLDGGDAFVLCVEQPDVARRALEGVADCARDALGGAGRAVRAAQPDDSTRFMRPLPGAARMYPETDVPPIRIAPQRWQDVLATLPARPEEKVAAYVATGLSDDLAKQVVRAGADGDLDQLIEAGAHAGQAARVLTTVAATWAHKDEVLARTPEVFAALDAGRFAKEALEDVLGALDADPDRSIDDAIAAAGAQAAEEDEMVAIIDRVVAERIDFVKERGDAAVGPLMGPVMAELRGKADGALISQRLKEAIERALG